jgi:CRP-like cAMP-binding protein
VEHQASEQGIARLGPAEREALAEYGARATWPSGFAIYQRGAPADGTFIVTRGRVVLRSRVRSGRGFIPWIATPGETFGSEGLSPGARYMTDARPEGEAETLFITSAKWRALLREQPQQALSLFSQLQAERSMLLEKLRELSTLSVEQRLLSTLVRLGATETFTTDDGQVVLCPQRYRLLCELVGATRESVTLVFGKLVSDGIVQRRGSDFVVGDRRALLARIDRSAVDLELPIGLLAGAATGGDSSALRA